MAVQTSRFKGRCGSRAIYWSVRENNFEHRILVPAGVEGVVEEISEGEFTVEETVVVIKTPDRTSRERP